MSMRSSTIPSPAVSSLVCPDRCRSYGRGDLFTLHPHELWHLHSGFIRAVTWHYEGQAATLGIWGPGDTIGTVFEQEHNAQFECLTAVILNCLTSQSLSAAVLQAATVHHLAQSQTLLSILHCRPIHLRLMKLLLWLAHRFGRPVEQGWVLELRLTHQAIAESIGTTRVTVTRLLQTFEQQGQVKRLRQHRYFLRPDRSESLHGLST